MIFCCLVLPLQIRDTVGELRPSVCKINVINEERLKDLRSFSRFSLMTLRPHCMYSQ